MKPIEKNRLVKQMERTWHKYKRQINIIFGAILVGGGLLGLGISEQVQAQSSTCDIDNPSLVGRLVADFTHTVFPLDPSCEKFDVGILGMNLINGQDPINGASLWASRLGAVQLSDGHYYLVKNGDKPIRVDLPNEIGYGFKFIDNNGNPVFYSQDEMILQISKVAVLSNGGNIADTTPTRAAIVDPTITPTHSSEINIVPVDTVTAEFAHEELLKDGDGYSIFKEIDNQSDKELGIKIVLEKDKGLNTSQIAKDMQQIKIVDEGRTELGRTASEILEYISNNSTKNHDNKSVTIIFTKDSSGNYHIPRIQQDKSKISEDIVINEDLLVIILERSVSEADLTFKLNTDPWEVVTNGALGLAGIVFTGYVSFVLVKCAEDLIPKKRVISRMSRENELEAVYKQFLRLDPDSIPLDFKNNPQLIKILKASNFAELDQESRVILYNMDRHRRMKKNNAPEIALGVAVLNAGHDVAIENVNLFKELSSYLKQMKDKRLSKQKAIKVNYAKYIMEEIAKGEMVVGINANKLNQMWENNRNLQIRNINQQRLQAEILFEEKNPQILHGVQDELMQELRDAQYNGE